MIQEIELHFTNENFKFNEEGKHCMKVQKTYSNQDLIL